MKNMKQFKDQIEIQDNIYLTSYDVTDLFKNISKTATYMSWGVTLKQNYYDTHLMLKVNGFLWKEWVSISLNGNDTFIVCKVKSSGEIIELWEEVYIDELLQTIDKIVEKNPEESEDVYDEKVEKHFNETLFG